MVCIMIGGTSDLPDTRSGTFVQTYDYREGRWQELPMTKYNRVGADCCLFDGKIYVCGGISQATSVERYDPQKAVWECLEEKMSAQMQYHQLISYCNKLWAVGSFIPGSLSINSPTIQSYPNSVLSSFECNDCTSSDYYYCDSEDIDEYDYHSSPIKQWNKNYNKYGTKQRYKKYKMNYVISHDIINPTPRHHKHQISTFTEKGWKKEDMLQNENHSTIGVILDGVVF